jgi:hypothetical protein
MLTGAQPSTSALHWRRYAVIAVVSIVIGLAALVFYPQIYGGDPIVRVSNSERFQLAYQLPMIQVVVRLAAMVSPDPVVLRLALIVIAALGACGMAALARTAVDGEYWYCAGLLFASNHFLIYLGNSPYQEVLELTLLLWGLALIFGARSAAGRAAGYVFIAAACFTRYEAWFVAAGAALVEIIQNRFRVVPALKSGLRWGAGPLSWLIWNAGFSPSGTVLFDPALRPARLWRIPYVIGATLNHTASAVALLALLGVVFWYREPRLRAKPAVLAWLAGGALFLVALPLTATGVLPDYDRYVTNREAHFLLPVIFLMATIALGAVRERFSARLVLAIIALVFAYEGYAAKKILDQSVAEGNLALDITLARRISGTLQPGERALIFARPYPPEELEHFRETVRRKQGESGLAAAERVMQTMNTWPLDFARIWVHAPRRRGGLVRVQAAAAAEKPVLAIVFDDYAPANEVEQALLTRVKTEAVRSERLPPPPLPQRSGAVVYLLSPQGAGSH